MTFYLYHVCTLESFKCSRTLFRRRKSELSRVSITSRSRLLANMASGMLALRDAAWKINRLTALKIQLREKKNQASVLLHFHVKNDRYFFQYKFPFLPVERKPTINCSFYCITTAYVNTKSVCCIDT